MLVSLDGLGGAAKARGMEVHLACAERERPGRAESMHTGMMMGFFIANHDIVFSSAKDTSKVS